MLYFFIGGPWNNQLRELPDGLRMCWKMPVLQPLPSVGEWNESPTIADLTVPCVTYRLADPLPTGCQVMSCLDVPLTGVPRVFHPMAFGPPGAGRPVWKP